MACHVLFKSGPLLVRELGESDVGLMAAWLSDPRVLEYYEGRDRPHDEARVREHFLARQGDSVTGCIVEYDQSPIGYIQYYLLTDAEKAGYGYPRTLRVYGIDLFIGVPKLWERGIGTSLVTTTADYLFDSKEADSVVVDPQTWNTRAVRCYEKSGFKKVKLLPAHELHEGAMRDCWLMERSNTPS